MPFGSEDEAFRNSSTLGFFSSTQALADYAQVIIDVKRNLSAENCPVIALGGSYGGSKSIKLLIAAKIKLLLALWQSNNELSIAGLIILLQKIQC